MADKETLKSRLRRYTCEYLGTLCEYNHLDVKDLKLKEDRVNALADLPELSEPMPALGATSMDVNTLLSGLLKQFQETRREDNENFLKSVDKLVASKPKSHSYTPVKLKEMTKLTDSDDIHHWFKTFENLAKRYEIPEAKTFPGAGALPHRPCPAGLLRIK